MIKLLHNYDCVGCTACFSACAKGAITMTPDAEGFVYPITDLNLCNDCGLCNKVCPVIIQAEPRTPISAFAAINKDEKIRLESSSGGVFSLLANKTLEAGGVVFGACFDSEWNVVHSFCETEADLAKFRGSKYVQSDMGDTFSDVKAFLNEGREVLFSGTPCQVAGLKLFLRKEYKNLFAVDFICHGVPSPLVWQRYKEEITNRHKIVEIIKMRFRDKSQGWTKFGFFAEIVTSSKEHKVIKENLEINIFLKGFLKDLYLRPSCHHCPTKKSKSGSDITIADFWRAEKVTEKYGDDKGISLILLNTEKGESEYQLLDIDQLKVDSHLALSYNSSFAKSPVTNPRREVFFKSLNNNKQLLSKIVNKLTRDSFYNRCKIFIKNNMRQWIKR